jgi:hypothetical protein
MIQIVAFGMMVTAKLAISATSHMVHVTYDSFNASVLQLVCRTANSTNRDSFALSFPKEITEPIEPTYSHIKINPRMCYNQNAIVTY